MVMGLLYEPQREDLECQAEDDPHQLEKEADELKRHNFQLQSQIAYFQLQLQKLEKEADELIRQNSQLQLQSQIISMQAQVGDLAAAQTSVFLPVMPLKQVIHPPHRAPQKSRAS